MENQLTNENFLTITKNNKKRRLTTFDYSSLTNVSPLNDLNNQIISPNLYEISDDEEEDQYILRPPPLMVLSQSIQAKHPEQLIDTKLTNRFSSIKDLPNAPANYSFAFYNLTLTFVFFNKKIEKKRKSFFFFQSNRRSKAFNSSYGRLFHIRSN